MISVNQAIDSLLGLVKPLETELCDLKTAHGRVLAKDVHATRNQPPFAASAMDGYAVLATDVQPHARFDVIGEAAAGHGFAGNVMSGQAVRIFTGAPLPAGTDHVLIQEDVTRKGNVITLNAEHDQQAYVRPMGTDFKIGSTLSAPRILSPREIALLASFNIPHVPVFKRPTIALISTGDELVMPGDTPNADQIIASNTFGLHAQISNWGGHARILPIAKDNTASIQATLELAKTADLIVTIGGASVGDHDLVAAAAKEMGLEQTFYKVRMRPGKPLMGGMLGPVPMIGLPGNPVSAMVCAELFLYPLISKMMGFAAGPRQRQSAQLAHDIDANGNREHYMRGRLVNGELTVFQRQDSALLSVLSDADILVIREPDDPKRSKGEHLSYILL